jgi:hypothetical protein
MSRQRGPTERKQPATEYLSRLDIAKLFGCNPSLVITLERQGRLTPIRITPKLVRYHRGEVDRLIKEGRGA